MSSTILRLHRTDKPKEHLLINVTSKQADTLDLKLVGTEHEHLYHARIKESNVKSLQASNYTGDLIQWRAIVRYALLHERPDTDLHNLLAGLEIAAAISGSILTINLRRNISGITQRLGSIKLEQDDEREEVAAFEWVDAAVADADSLRQQLEALQASVSGQQEQVAALTKQLNELVQAKRDHEAELLKKFAALLNAKKLKIRDQQRLLSGAKIDPETAEATRSARDGTGRRAKASRGGKRKATEDGDDDKGEVRDEDAPEDVLEYEEQRRDEETSEATEDDGLGGDDSDGFEQPIAPTQRSSKGKGKANGTATDEELPPVRELPFKRKASPVPTEPTKPATPDDDDEDETDDEL